jgi:hypothetical protein
MFDVLHTIKLTTSLSTYVLKKPIIPELFKSTSHFIDTASSLPLSGKPVTGPYPEQINPVYLSLPIPHT